MKKYILIIYPDDDGEGAQHLFFDDLDEAWSDYINLGQYIYPDIELFEAVSLSGQPAPAAEDNP